MRYGLDRQIHLVSIFTELIRHRDKIAGRFVTLASNSDAQGIGERRLRLSFVSAQQKREGERPTNGEQVSLHSTYARSSESVGTSWAISLTLYRQIHHHKSAKRPNAPHHRARVRDFGKVVKLKSRAPVDVVVRLRLSRNEVHTNFPFLLM